MLNKNYGIQAAALAVQAYLENYDGIESSWNSEKGRYMASPSVAPWYNGRERGIVVYMHSKASKGQINIVVYEHRNSDHICAVVWEQHTYINPPSLTGMPADIMQSKWDFTKMWSYTEAVVAAQWIYEQLDKYWPEGKLENPNEV